MLKLFHSSSQKGPVRMATTMRTWASMQMSLRMARTVGLLTLFQQLFAQCARLAARRFKFGRNLRRVTLGDAFLDFRVLGHYLVLVIFDIPHQRFDLLLGEAPNSGDVGWMAPLIQKRGAIQPTS